MIRRRKKQDAETLAVECVVRALIMQAMPNGTLDERRAFLGALTSRAFTELRRRSPDDETQKLAAPIIARLVPEP